MPLAIDARNLKKTYGTIQALDDVSIQVAEGEIFGFLGPNGAGKSTFIKILLNLITADYGTAQLFGVDVRDTNSRNSMGFLPENIRAYNFLTIEEFLQFHGKLIEIPKKMLKDEITRCLNTLGIKTYRKRRISTLSKGLMQRVGIAQAILKNPKLLFLDEPTSGLDPIGVTELRKLLSVLKGRGTTVFLNSHLLSEVERTCDKIAILNKGKIIRSGTRSDVSGKEKQLEVAVEGFTEIMAKQINDITQKPLERNGNILKIYPSRHEDAVEVHRIIVDQGGTVLSLCWKGESLEELFYRLIKHEDMGNS